MKKILIVNNNLHMGGVQRALINLLWSIHDKYDVTLLLFHDSGMLRKELPPDVRLCSVRSAYRWLGMSRSDAKQNLKDRFFRNCFAAATRLFGRKTVISLMKRSQPALEGFDVAISYLHNSRPRSFYGGCNEFVLNHVHAKEKIAFLHGDFRSFGAVSPEYSHFDRIAACSEGCAAAFRQICPSLSHKVTVVRNCHRFREIQALAERDNIALQEDKLNILTVARLSPEKGILPALQAILSLKDPALHYTIIGEGKERKSIERFLAEHKLTRSVTLLGELENPYPAMKNADLLLIPSRHEAAPLVIDEAACLGLPILSTETCSARELVEQRGYGWVCENSAEGIAAALKRLSAAPELLREKRRFLASCSHSNEDALRQFQNLLGR